MATFRKLPSGKWQAQIRIKGHKLVSVTARTKAEAQRLAVKAEDEIRSGVRHDKSVDVPLSEVFDWNLSHVTPLKSATNQSPERATINVLKEHLGDKTFYKITAADLVDFARKRKLQGIKPATISRNLSLVSSCMRYYAVEHNIRRVPDLITDANNATSDLGLAGPSMQRDRRMAGDEEASIMLHLDPEMQIIVCLLVETALRRSELCKARHEHIKGSVLVVAEHKTAKQTRAEKQVPLSPTALELIDALPVREDGFLIGLKPARISAKFAKACERAGVSNLRIHDLRHEALSRLAGKGFDQFKLRKFSGHTDINMLSRYVNLRSEDIAKELAEMSKASK